MTIDFEVRKDGGCNITGVSGNDAEFIIPATMSDNNGTYNVKYVKISTLSERANRKTKTIVIPEGVEVLGDYCFYLFAGLEKLVLPSTIKTVGNHAFCGCNSLKEIFLSDKIQSIGKSAFGGCSSLTTLNIT